jgi:hypothetical protein
METPGLLHTKWCLYMQTTPILAGLAVGVAAYAGKAALELATKLRSAPRMRQFYKASTVSEMPICRCSRVTGVFLQSGAS